jgi:protein MpaA
MPTKIFHQTSWALTSTGRPLELYKKTHTLAHHLPAEKPLLFIGGVHGDEPEGVRLAQDFLQWLLAEEKNVADNHGAPLRPWLLIPCLNPDGFNMHQRTNYSGVDLNRNFPSKDWEAHMKAPRYYPGPSAGSESEVKALVQLIEDEKPQLIVHFHSWEPCVVYTGSPGRDAAEMLGQGTGYEVREDIGYPTPGSLGQYAWEEKKIPVVCIETQEKSDLDTIWPTFAPGLKKLMRSRKTEISR